MDQTTQFAGDEQFNLLRHGADEIDLIALMLELSADANPLLDQHAVRLQICELGREFRSLLGPMFEELYEDPTLLHAFETGQWDEIPLGDAHEARPLLMAAVGIFRHNLGFVGDDEGYYQPANSYLPEILERRKGIPISLAILFQELAAKCGLPLYGVSTPGHFVLGYPAEEPLYIDVYGGEVMTQRELRHKIEQITREPLWADDVFLPASHLSIAARVLRNLKGAYARLEDWGQALQVQQRLASLLPDLSDEQRDLGLLLVRVGQAWPALEILEPYIEQRPKEAESLEPFVRAARRMMAQWN